ncbi:MAG: hypothetical protein E2P02_02010 [Acidobacteria bacterium]|nr:MAG: hypothetical protein E2P02_02010 [Acidobacteriota bacterium]
MAIKVLPDEFAQDTERLRRFQREAKVLASLNHPNIAAIYGLEQFEGTQYLALELVPGLERASGGARPTGLEPLGPMPQEGSQEPSSVDWDINPRRARRRVGGNGAPPPRRVEPESGSRG